MTEWKLVPVEPEYAMLNAAIDVDSYKLGDISPLGFRESPQQLFERCYRAMLAASPAPPDVVGVLESIVENEHQFSMGWAAERARALIAQLKGEAK